MTKDALGSDRRLAKFAFGFDVILEDTTFRMFTPNRVRQIEFVTQHLKADGIFVFVEKFRAPHVSDYQRRENQKDFGFKALFFTRGNRRKAESSPHDDVQQ